MIRSDAAGSVVMMMTVNSLVVLLFCFSFQVLVCLFLYLNVNN